MNRSGRWAKSTLVGELVTLRPMSIGDADAAWEMVNDPESTGPTATVATLTFDRIRDWCARSWVHMEIAAGSMSPTRGSPTR